MTDPAAQLIEEEEGRNRYAYQDQFGYWTIGVGHLIDGRKGGFVDDDIISTLLERDIADKTQFLKKNVIFSTLGGYQQAAIISMAFQLGEEGINEFHTMWSKLAQKDWGGAARAALNSEWAKQTSKRAAREAEMLRTNQWVAKT
jgi:lysozyme